MDGDTEAKSYTGGALTIFAQFLMCFIFISGFYKMVINHNPYIQSIETAVHTKQAYKFGEMNPMYFALIDHNDKYHTLSEAKRYVEFKIIHNHFTYSKTNNKIKENKKTTQD